MRYVRVSITEAVEPVYLAPDAWLHRGDARVVHSMGCEIQVAPTQVFVNVCGT